MNARWRKFSILSKLEAETMEIGFAFIQPSSHEWSVSLSPPRTPIADQLLTELQETSVDEISTVLAVLIPSFHGIETTCLWKEQQIPKTNQRNQVYISTIYLMYAKLCKYWFGAFPGVSRNQSVSWLSYGFQTEVDASWERSRSKIQRYSERALRVRVLAKDPYHWWNEISSKWMTVLKQPLPSSACWALPLHQLSTNHPKKTLTAQALTRNICELETFSKIVIKQPCLCFTMHTATQTKNIFLNDLSFVSFDMENPPGFPTSKVWLFASESHKWSLLTHWYTNDTCIT